MESECRWRRIRDRPTTAQRERYRKVQPGCQRTVGLARLYIFVHTCQYRHNRLWCEEGRPTYSSPKFSPLCLEGLFPSHRKAGRGKLCGPSMAGHAASTLTAVWKHAAPRDERDLPAVRRFPVDVSRGALRFGSLTNPSDEDGPRGTSIYKYFAEPKPACSSGFHSLLLELLP